MKENTIKTSKINVLPDGSAFCTMSLPLPNDHWLYKETEEYEPPPMPFRIGNGKRRRRLANKIIDAARYAIRSTTMNGKEDYDPDAWVQNMIVGMLGYWTDTGLSEDNWAKSRHRKKGVKMRTIILIAILILSACKCGTITQQDAQTAVTVAQGVLEFIDGLLTRVEINRSNCDWLVNADTEVKLEGRRMCTDVNDAEAYVLDLKRAYQLAVKQGNEAEIKSAEEDLWEAGRELDNVLKELEGSRLVRIK